MDLKEFNPLALKFLQVSPGLEIIINFNKIPAW